LGARRLSHRAVRADRTNRRRELRFEPLEDRILLSADTGLFPQDLQLDAMPSTIPETVVSTEELLLTDNSAADHDSRQITSAQSQSTLQPAQEASGRELVIIDPSLPDYRELLQEIPDAEKRDVFILDARKDGISQISDILSGQQDLETVHILSHGSQGALHLGNGWVTTTGLEKDAAQVQGWRGSLLPEADILLYGCGVGQGDAVLEIGPGFGAVTDHLIKRVPRLYLVEIAPQIVDFLAAAYQPKGMVHVIEGRTMRYLGHIPEKDGITVVHGDIMAIPWPRIDAFVSNLPFQLSADFFFRWLESGAPGNGAFIVQKQFADHITARPRSAHFTAISAAAMMFLRSETIARLSPRDFFPPIEVSAVILRCAMIYGEKWHPLARKLLIALIKRLFSNKRRPLHALIPDLLRDQPALHEDFPGLLPLSISTRFKDRCAWELNTEEWTLLFAEVTKPQP